jgi:hypothetical protein
MYEFSPFMVAASAYGRSRPLYGDVYTGGGYGEEVYYPIWVAA